MDSILGWIFVTTVVFYFGFRFMIICINEDIARKAQNRAEWDEFFEKKC